MSTTAWIIHRPNLDPTMLDELCRDLTRALPGGHVSRGRDIYGNTDWMLDLAAIEYIEAGNVPGLTVGRNHRGEVGNLTEGAMNYAASPASADLGLWTVDTDAVTGTAEVIAADTLGYHVGVSQGGTRGAMLTLGADEARQVAAALIASGHAAAIHRGVGG